MASVAARLGIVAENTFSLGEVSPVQRFHVNRPPPLQGSMVFRGGRSSWYGDGKGAYPFQFRLLHLLAAQKTDRNKNHHYDIAGYGHRNIAKKKLGIQN